MLSTGEGGVEGWLASGMLIAERTHLACPHPKLAQQRRDVVVDGLGRDDETFRDLGVTQAFGEEREHLELQAFGEHLELTGT